MSQRLILPIDDMLVTAGYKNENYKKQFGFVHYGLDCVSASGTRTIHASGAGEIADCGQDGALLSGVGARLGNVIVVVYRDVLCADGKVRDLTSRVYHLDKILVRKGDKVTHETPLGQYGNTGAYSSGAHLHIEFDVDIQFPTLTPGIAAGGRVINKAAEVQKYGRVDSTLNPAKLWFVGGGQTLSGRIYSGEKSYLPEDATALGLPVAGKQFFVFELVQTFVSQDQAKLFADSRGKKTMIVAE